MVTIHPNIPALDDSKFTVVWHQVGVVLFSLVMPGLIVLWTIRQWMMARLVSRDIRQAVESSGGRYLMN